MDPSGHGWQASTPFSPSRKVPIGHATHWSPSLLHPPTHTVSKSYFAMDTKVYQKLLKATVIIPRLATKVTCKV